MLISLIQLFIIDMDTMSDSTFRESSHVRNLQQQDVCTNTMVVCCRQIDRKIIPTKRKSKIAWQLEQVFKKGNQKLKHIWKLTTCLVVTNSLGLSVYSLHCFVQMDLAKFAGIPVVLAVALGTFVIEIVNLGFLTWHICSRTLWLGIE